MGRKSKKAIARIMALLMAFALLPFDLWGTANMVIAEEQPEAYTEEAASTEDDAAVTEDITDTQEEETDDAVTEEATDADEETSDAVLTEEVTDAEKTEEDSAYVSDDKVLEEIRDNKEEKEKTSTESQEDLKANTEGYELSKTTEWVFSKEFFTELGYTKNGAITADKPIEGITMISSTAASNKMTETPSSLALGAGVKIGLVVQEDTDAAEITITLAGNPNNKRYIYIGTGEKKETVYHTNSGAYVEGNPYFASGVYTNQTLYLKEDGMFTTTLDIEGCVGDNKIASITLKEYKISGSQSEKVAIPTAVPDSGEVEAGDTITLSCTTTGAKIYYTTDGSTPDASKNKYQDGITIPNDMVDNKITIKAIAMAEGKENSEVAEFTYTIKKAAISIGTSDTSIVSSIKAEGDVSFVNQNNEEVSNVQLKVEKVTTPSDSAIQQEAQKHQKENGTILYYNFTLENENGAVKLAEGTNGKLKIKMPYSIVKPAASKADEIIVLHNTTVITPVNKEEDGFSFSADSFSPYTVIINPVSDEGDSTETKTYVLDPEAILAEQNKESITASETTNYVGTENYFKLLFSASKGASLCAISTVTSNSTNCYNEETLDWTTYASAIGKRTKCLRLTGGGLGIDKNDTSETKNQALNGVKITTKYPKAKVIVYYSPKGTKKRNIKVTKVKMNGNIEEIGADVGTYGTEVDNTAIAKAEFTLQDATDYFIGFSGDGGIIPYMEVTETPVEEEVKVDKPTAVPESGAELNRKSTIELKAEEDVTIYYTTNGDTPDKTTADTTSSSTKTYEQPIVVADLTPSNNKLTIKAIAVKGKGTSEIATFTYTYDPNAVAVAIDDASKAIIKEVQSEGDISKVKRGNTSLTVTDITLKAEELQGTKIDEKIKAAAEALVSDENKDKSNIKYYSLTLVLNEETSASTDTVTFTETDAKLKIKMPYSIFKTDVLGDVTEDNPIIILHNEDPIDEGKITQEIVTSQNAEDAGFWFDANSFSPYTVIVNPAPEREIGSVKITEYDGYEEGVYAEWEAYQGADGYKAYIATEKDGKYTRIDNELIREYKDYWRVDTVGLAKGSSYYLKVEAVKVKTEGDDENVEVLAEKEVGPLTVTNYDRSGFAFSKDSPLGSGSGAYNDDGTLKKGAQVIYVTKDTAKTCKAMIHTGGASKPAVEVTGLQSILDAKQKKGTENDIIDIRIIGLVKKDDLDHISSTAEGLQVKGAAKYSEMNITIEGIGEDAAVHGFGFLIRNCGNVELRNFAIMAFMDDGVSLDTANCNIWVHDLDIFYGSTGGDSDQAKGDGSVDVKGKSDYITVSYNHFWDSGKCSLCGMSDSEEFRVTYHHNWFDHSDSRHPRIRVGSIHVYNNYFDGNSKYGVGVTKGSSAFVEANYFRNCKYPMLISQQGSDLSGDGKGTFSGEPGGIIKAYNNKIEGAQRLVYANTANGSTAANATEFDAYLAASRSEKVPSTYKTLNGGTNYNNFDTSYDLGVTASNIDSPEDVERIVTQKAGRLNGGDFEKKPGYVISNDDESYAVDTVLKADVVNYKSSIVFIGGIKGASSGPDDGDGPGGGDEPDDGDEPGGDTPIIPGGGGIYVHNFTEDGFTSGNFFKITGNKQSKPTSFQYTDVKGNVLTLSQALKMESSTSVTFNATASGTLILVFPSDTTKATKVDGTNMTPVDGIIDVYFDTAGAHEIKKKDTVDLYYIAYIEDTYDTNDVREPMFSIPSGDIKSGDSLTLDCETDGAEIHYTKDGTDPTSSSPKYTAGTPIVLEGEIGTSVTIKAIAIKDDKESPIGSRTYTFVDPSSYIPAPVASEQDGALKEGTEVALSINPEDSEVKIYYTYTTDGTDPEEPDTETGTLYTKPILVSTAMTIKAIAVKGENSSSVSTFKYTISSGSSGDDTTGNKTFEFNPQAEGLDKAALPSADTQYGTDKYFSVKGNTKAKISSAGDKGVAAPAGSKSGSNIDTYMSRFQFGGKVATKDTDGAIRFTTYGSAKVTICAYLTGKDNTTGEYVNRSVYLDADTTSWKPEGGIPTEHTFEVDAGSHGIYAKDGDLAILYVVVEDTNVPGGPSDDDNKPVSKPEAVPAAGTYSKGTKISLSASGADIYYTTNNETPTTSSAKYTTATEIILNDDMVIKAIAVVNGKSSEVAIFEYKVTQDTTPPAENQVSMPEANYPTKTTVKKGTAITLTCDPADAEIHYTLGGAVPTKDSDLYTNPIVINEDTIIKALAIKGGYKDSEIATFEYTVAKDEDVKQVTEPTANIVSGTAVQKGTAITLTCDPADAEIRYTLNETTPTENSILYTKPIEINENTTIKAYAAKQGYISSAVVTFVYTVIEDDPTIPEGSGLRVVLKNEETYTYTGSAIKPEILVYNNNDRLVEGTDYTVQYKNNINASTDAASNKKPQIIVRGRRNLTGSVYTTFEIEKKDLSDSNKGAGAVEVSGITSDGELLVVENTKLSPALYYGGVKLSGKYFSVSKTGKYTLADTGSEIVIAGKNNFAGELKYKVKVVSKGSLKKFAVSFKNPNYIYNGQSQIFELAEGDVKDISKTETNGASLKKGIDYTVVYQKDTTNAGNVKFTVVGLGYYTGAVTKSYTIKPNAVTSGMKMTGVSGRPYPYVGTGVTISDVKVSYNDIPLEEGRDYKLIYGGNKKMGTAKVTASFIGNYKGSASVSKFFTIGANALTNGAAGLKITVADMVYKKPGTYKSVPQVSVNGIEIKASNFIVKYYTDETLEKEVSSRNKIILSDKDAYKTVYMKITGKDRGNYQGTELTASYKVCQQTLGDFYDLSKARLIVYTNWSDSALRTNRMEHTGRAVEPGVAIEFRQDGAKIDLTPTEVKQLIDSGKLTIQYVNNVNRGRATIVVNGDGATYAGGKKVTFNIITRNIKNTDILDDLFTNAVEKCNVRYLLQNP